MNGIDALVVITAMVLIVAVVVVLLSYHQIAKFGTLIGVTTAPILLIDPASAPPGAQSILVSYSSLAVESNGIWSNAAGSGTINVMTVANNSRILGYFTVATGSELEAVRIYLNSVKIKENGILYNVSVPNPNVTIVLSGNSVINPKSGILIGLLSAAETQNTTAFAGASDPANYTMVLYTKAVLLGGMDNITNTYFDRLVKINNTIKQQFGFLPSPYANIVLKGPAPRLPPKRSSRVP